MTLAFVTIFPGAPINNLVSVQSRPLLERYKVVTASREGGLPSRVDQQRVSELAS